MPSIIAYTFLRVVFSFRFFWVEAQQESRPDKQLAPFFFTETSS
jgi:hypothetical protein